MTVEPYKIIGTNNGWSVDYVGLIEGDYVNKEAAFQAAVTPASNAIRDGVGITISVAEREPRETNLGNRWLTFANI